MTEPAGRTIDGTPWKEARGPHLPDPLTRLGRRLPLMAWIFWILAVLDLGWNLFGRVGGVSVSVATLATVLPCLFGAALFARHPRAWHTDRLLAIGVTLLAVVEGLGIAREMFGSTIEGIGAVEEDIPFLSLGSIGALAFTEAISIFAILYLGRGLATRRRGDEPAGFRTRGMIIIAFPVAISVVSLAGIAIQASRGQIDLGIAGYLPYVVVNLAAQILTLFAWAYLTRVAAAGSAAQDAPHRAWRLASIAGWLFLGSYLVDGLVFLAVSDRAGPDSDITGLILILSLTALGKAIGVALLVTAFVVGLPSEDNG